MLAALIEKGVPPAAVVPLITRFAKRRNNVSLEDAAAALNGARIQCLHSDYASAVQAMDFGQTLSQAAPRSSLRRDIQDLARGLSAVTAGKV